MLQDGSEIPQILQFPPQFNSLNHLLSTFSVSPGSPEGDTRAGSPKSIRAWLQQGLVSHRQNPSHSQQQEGSASCRNTVSNLIPTLQGRDRGLGIQHRTRKIKTYTGPDRERAEFRLLAGWESCRELPCACLWVRTVSGLGTCLLSSCVGPTWLGLGRDRAATLVLGLDVGLLDTLDRSCWERGTAQPHVCPRQPWPRAPGLWLKVHFPHHENNGVFKAGKVPLSTARSPLSPSLCPQHIHPCFEHSQGW